MKWLILSIMVGLPIIAQVFLPARRVVAPLPTSIASWSPQDINTIRYYWVSSDLAVDTPVETWTDRIQGALAQMEDSAKRPTNYATGLFFNGTSQYLTNNPTFHGYISGTTAAVFIVIRPYNPVGWLGAVLHRDANGIMGFYASRFTSPFPHIHFYGNAGNAAVSGVFVDDTWFDIAISVTNQPVNNTTVIYTNGIPKITNTTGIGWIQKYFGFGTDTGIGPSTLYYKGYILELAWFSDTITSADVTLLHNYATNTYGFTP